MKAFSYTITDEAGIHARPAGLLVKLVKDCSSSVTLEVEGKPAVSASALIKVMGLGVKRGETIKITVEGDNEAHDAEVIETFLKGNL